MKTPCSFFLQVVHSQIIENGINNGTSELWRRRFAVCADMGACNATHTMCTQGTLCDCLNSTEKGTAPRNRREQVGAMPSSASCVAAKSGMAALQRRLHWTVSSPWQTRLRQKGVHRITECDPCAK